MASPIFYPKSPTDMGGAPATGGGADLSALGFTQIDLTDGATWTLTDPDSLVDTVVALAGGVNQVTMNALTSGSNDYAWTAGTNQRAPRWTTPLYAQDANGANVRVTSGDTYVLQTVIEYDAPDDRFATEIVVASAEDGTATTSGANKAQGGALVITGTGGIRMGAFTGNTPQLSTANPSNHQNLATANHAGGRAQAVAYVNIDSNGDQLAGSSRNSGMTYTDTTTDLNLMVGLGTFSLGTITAGEDAKIRAWYRVVVFNLPA